MQGILSIQSHVVYGCAGNSSAVFPLQRLKHTVWPIHTVQFSNHTQYSRGWTGTVLAAGEITELIEGMVNIDAVNKVKAVVSGYLGSGAQADEILAAIERVKTANPAALYICDPVMGDPEKGCIVGEDVTTALCERLMKKADIIVPNQFELSQFTGIKITSVETAYQACQQALTLGPKIVLVKHLHCASAETFTMLLATQEQSYLIERPLFDFERQPVGVGDLITAIFSGHYLNSGDAVSAFEYCNNAVYAVLEHTKQAEEWELQIVPAQDAIASTDEVLFKAKAITL